MIEKKAFGRTGHMSTRAIFGGAAMGREDLTAEESERTLAVLMEYGGNHLDVAAAYGKGRAEKHMGAWMGRIQKLNRFALRQVPAVRLL